MTAEPAHDTALPAIPRWATLPVDRRWLFAIAGAIWSAVGMLLMVYAVTWLAPVPLPLELGLGAAGLIVAAVFVRFVFSGIVRKNIARIERGPARASAWAFQGWRSYVVTAFMIALGILLRTSSLPKPDLAVVYEGIGIALLLTSVPYHRKLSASLRT